MIDCIDIHPHVISDDLARHPLSPLTGEQSTWSRERPVTYEQLLRAMDAAGVSRAALVQASTCYGHDNRYVAEAVAAHPDRFTGVFSVDVTAADAPLNASLAHVRDLTERLNGPRGGVGVLMGNERDARRLLDVLSGAQAALRSVEALAQRADAVIGRADERLLGPGGLTQDAQGAVRELQGALADARGTLRRLDGVLQEAQAIGSNVRGATTDLGSLRADVEASLRKVESLINDVQRRWPFARDAEVKLP